MDTDLIAWIGLSLALCALFLTLFIVMKRGGTAPTIEEFAAHRRAQEQRYDEFIDHRDKARTWMKREQTRAARETNAETNEVIETVDPKAWKNELRRRAASIGRS